MDYIPGTRGYHLPSELRYKFWGENQHLQFTYNPNLTKIF